MKPTILAVLASASLAACGTTSPETSVDEASELASATLSFPFPDGRGCVSAPQGGTHFRVHAVSASHVELQVYDASTGALVRTSTFSASRVGDVIRLGTFSSTVTDASYAEIRREVSQGRTRTILTLSRFGEPSREVEVTCDVDAGLEKIVNAKRLEFATAPDIVSETTTFDELRPSTCTAPTALSRGPFTGTRVRIAITEAANRGQAQPTYKARVEFVDPAAHWVMGYYSADVARKTTGEGYELRNSYNAAVLANISVGSGPPRNALTLRAEDPTLKDMLAGEVAIGCELVGP